MTHVSRPLIALLVATVAFFALWIVALRPSSSSTSSNSGSYQSAIKAAHQAVTASASGAHPGTTSTSATGAPGNTASAPAATHAATTPGAAATANGSGTSATANGSGTSATATGSGASATATRSGASAAVTVVKKHDSRATRHRINVVNAAIVGRRVVALLFYNPAATDDRAVKHELATIPTHHKRVVSLAVPIAELTRYPVVTTEVPVNQSPTLVIIDARRQASTIVGFADRFEISQRVQDALAVK